MSKVREFAGCASLPGDACSIRLNSLKLLETEVQNPKSGFEAVKCIPPPGVPPFLLDLGN